MRLNQILKATPKTENLIAISSEVSTQDFLVIVQRAAKKLCHLGYLYVNIRGNGENVLAKEPNEINFEEFTYLLRRRRDAVEVMLDQRDCTEGRQQEQV